MAGKHQNKAKSGKQSPNSASVVLVIALTLALAYFVWGNISSRQTVLESPPPSEPVESQSPQPNNPDDPESQPPAEELIGEFNPYAVDSTRPSNYLSGTAVEVQGTIVESFAAAEGDFIDFGFGKHYTTLEGVITFRGNNFRDGGAYGTAEMVNYGLSTLWSVRSGALTAPDNETWTGSGWVGQPLIVKWPSETKQIMNMYDWAKAKDGLVEVIYATMDGNVYFLELGTGEKTRDTLFIGYTFKGSGALDPRGYPLLYLGAGYNSNKGASRAFIVSLIDGSILYEFGNGDSFALRPWPMFDGSPLVDAETDQLIYPGENGVLYIAKLNTAYDPAAGTISVSPAMTKWRYSSNRAYWLGMEDSPVILRGHIIMSDNGGNLMCVNLNTLETVWVQDVLDDTNCSPVLEIEDGHPYVYISTSFHAGWRAAEGQTALIPIWKIDAVTGEIVWQTDYYCHTASGTSGGVQGTIAIGKNNLSDLIFVPVAKTPYALSGKIVALDKKTGVEVWMQETQMYAWSSPTVVYDSNGDGYVIYCTTGGYMYLFDGRTGKDLAHLDLGSNIEASPAVYNNTIVVGTRGQQIYGIGLT